MTMTTYEVRLQPSGKVFEAQGDKSILTASLDEGISLAYSCRAGMCGSCKAKIVAGQVDHGGASLTYLSEQERAAGYAMLCQARAQSDLVIEVDEIPLFDGVKPRITPGRVAKLDRAADDVMVLTVRVPMNENLRFVAGQYIDVLLPGDERRSYSIATAPALEGVTELEFHIRHMPGGLFTDHVFSAMKLREILTLEGPFGTFFLREDSDKPIIFVASGTGAAPVKSMLAALFKKGVNKSRPVHFYWGGRTANCLYMAGLMSQWQHEHENFVFVPVVSDATESCQWQGRTGFVHRAVMDDFADLSGHQVYACGSPLMVSAARTDFMRHRGLPQDEFFADEFLSAADRATAAASTPTRPSTQETSMTQVRDMTDDGIVDIPERTSVIKPYVLSHGTLECANLGETRKFFEEFLGLQCVQHGTTSMVFRCGLKFHVVCVQVGDDVHPCSVLNHWGIDVTSKAEVDAAYQAALQYKDQYRIKQVMAPEERHGVYSLYLEDLDSNWWEIQYYSGFQHDDMFDFGDRFSPDGQPILRTSR